MVTCVACEYSADFHPRLPSRAACSVQTITYPSLSVILAIGLISAVKIEEKVYLNQDDFFWLGGGEAYKVRWVHRERGRGYFKSMDGMAYNLGIVGA